MGDAAGGGVAGAAAAPCGVSEPVVSLGRAASVLGAADCARSARSKRSTSLLYCAPVVRRVASRRAVGAAPGAGGGGRGPAGGGGGSASAPGSPPPRAPPTPPAM